MALLKDKLRNRTLILASQSPRRRELMAGGGLDFRLAEHYETDETYPPTLPASQVAGYVAGLKSERYPWPLSDDEILITADTVVVLGGTVLGKPHDGIEAMEMITSLSGKKHTVITGVVIRSKYKRAAFSVATDVWFRSLRHEEAEYYVNTFKPLDKAGAYGIQEWIGYTAIERISGSFYNVMGLPIQTLYVQLEKFVE